MATGPAGQGQAAHGVWAWQVSRRQQVMVRTELYGCTSNLTLLIILRLQKPVLLGIDGMLALGVYVDTNVTVINIGDKIVGQLVRVY